MNSKLRTLAAALLITTATATGAALMNTTVAEAAGAVRAAVGKALNEAINDAKNGNGNAAMAKIHEAESVGGLTAAEQQAIAQTKEYVAAKTGAGGGKTGSQAKFTNDYLAGRYSAVVGSDADELRKAGAMTGEDELLIAQAYYLMHNYEDCIRHIRSMGRLSQQELELLNRCAYEAHDTAAQQAALEQLVVDFNQQKYWADLLDNADRTSGLNNQDTLDIYRVRMLTGTMKGKSDFETATEIAIQLGFPVEAQAFAQKGLDSKQLDADRGARLLNMAKTQAATDAANFAKVEAAAKAAKTGDALVKVGDQLWSQGKYQDSLDSIKAGIAKGGLTNADAAQISLARAYISLHQRDAAVKALAEVSKTAPAHTLAMAKLWSIFARTH
jgi:hypothetical protein